MWSLPSPVSTLSAVMPFNSMIPSKLTCPRDISASLGVQWQPRYASQPLTLSDALAGVIPYYTGIVRRDAWQQVGGYAAHDPDVDESVMIWLRLVQLCDVRLIDAPLGWYRIRGDSLSRDPAKKEAFEQALITAFSRTALCTASATDRVIAEDTVARLRYHQELRRARWALMDGEIRSARRHARLAFAYSPGLRPGLVVASLAISPAMLQWLHPHKQRAAAVWLRVRERWVARRRGPAEGGLGDRMIPQWGVRCSPTTVLKGTSHR